MPIFAIALLLVAAVCQAESVVIVKRLPPGDPVAANAIGMLLGGTLLIAVSLGAQEPLVLPTQSDTLLAMAYLIGPGSIGVFLLALYVLARWTASATSYAFLLFPLVAIVLGAVLFDEPVQPSFLLGGAVVLVGVYVGAIYRPRPSRGTRGRRGVADATARRIRDGYSSAFAAISAAVAPRGSLPFGQ